MEPTEVIQAADGARRLGGWMVVPMMKVTMISTVTSAQEPQSMNEMIVSLAQIVQFPNVTAARVRS